MGIYARFVLPRVIDAAMQDKAVTAMRRQVVPEARGTVLEAGIGSGLNLPFYGPSVVKLYGVDPSAELLAMARRRVSRVGFPVELLHGSADRIPLPDHHVDTVVMTWTLCSVQDPAAALRDVRRVLKPGGTLLFVEHGLSPDADVRKWQWWINPVWSRIAGGCNLTRKADDLLRQAGFVVDVRTSYQPGPRPMTYTYEGSAAPIRQAG